MADGEYARVRRRMERDELVFVDERFPPTSASLFVDASRPSDLVWRRPSQLVRRPRLFVDGARHEHVAQGVVGDCYLLSAAAAVARQPALLVRLFPDAAGQDWHAASPEQHPGVFRVRLWRFGSWQQVIVDDLLPTTADGRLAYARALCPDEFWICLLEKACAKLAGCYELLSDGALNEALLDLTGGFVENEHIDAKDAAAVRAMPARLQQLLEQRALVVGAVASAAELEPEQPTLDACLLIADHSYTLLQADSDAVVLYNCLKGSETKSRERAFVDYQQHVARLRQETSACPSGEFRLPWPDFFKYFRQVSVCQLPPPLAPLPERLLSALRHVERPTVVELHAQWTISRGRRLRAGGSPFYLTWLKNPQFLINVPKDASAVVLQLVVKDSRGDANPHLRGQYPCIGLSVARAAATDRRLTDPHRRQLRQSAFVHARTVHLRLCGLPTGRYVVIPATYSPCYEAPFLLRLSAPFDVTAKQLTA